MYHKSDGKEGYNLALGIVRIFFKFPLDFDSYYSRLRPSAVRLCPVISDYEFQEI